MKTKWGILTAGALAACFVLDPAGPGSRLEAADPSGPSRETARQAERGEAIFAERCSACHTIGGGDRATGPDLQGVTERRDRRWILRIIREPGSLAAEKDPQRLALMERYSMTMPDLGVGEKEADALYAYLAHPAEAEHAAGEATAPREAVSAGDPGRGQALYVGDVPFTNGGAPCLACHGFAGLGSGGNAAYGADLTSVYENYGAEGVASVLADLPFPSMEPIYAERPLTEEEQADLAAFLQTGEGKALGDGAGAPFVKALIGFAVLLLLTFLFGMKRLRGVRRPLLETRPHNTEG